MAEIPVSYTHLGRINDERFSMMSRGYETEQEQLKVEIQTLQQDFEVQERQIENLEQFIQRAYTVSYTHLCASTGTSIASLSGAAATNATLAFFGGGSLAAGGLGMAGGTAVLGGLDVYKRQTLKL